MDKKTATLTLTEKLRDFNTAQAVINPNYQKKLVDNALACYQVGDVVSLMSYGVRDTIKNKNTSFSERLEPKANYLFVENFEVDKRILLSSFAIIGEEEVSQLRNTFYKNVPSDIETAMNILGIKNYIGLYEKYSSGELNKEISEMYTIYLKFKNSLRDKFTSKKSYCQASDIENYLGIGQKELDRILHEHNTYRNFGWESGISFSSVSEFVSDLVTMKDFDIMPDFLNLVFTLPYDDQNIESNKAILRLPSDTLDYVKILSDEYFKGKNFQDYFECLNSEKQKKVISALDFRKANNAIYNSYLWSKGFKTIGLDHLRLYKDDTKGFMEYFNTKTVEEKKSIINDLMKSEITNEEVVNWLTKNHMDLVREVGLSDN